MDRINYACLLVPVYCYNNFLHFSCCFFYMNLDDLRIKMPIFSQSCRFLLLISQEHNFGNMLITSRLGIQYLILRTSRISNNIIIVKYRLFSHYTKNIKLIYTRVYIRVVKVYFIPEPWLARRLVSRLWWRRAMVCPK